MILIKDRHANEKPSGSVVAPSGKYDTYNGSTLIKSTPILCIVYLGKYDTYKESAQVSRIYDFLWNYGKSYGIASS